MKVIILAGGKGARLPLSAKNIPKPLAKCYGKCLLDYQIEFLEESGFSDIRLSLSYRAEKIIEHMKSIYGNRYEWVIEPEMLGTGGAIKFASSDLEDEFIAFNVDDFPEMDFKDFVKFHKSHSIENTVAIYKVSDARDFGLVNYDHLLVQKFLEKPKKKIAGYINTGFYILNPQPFKEFPQKVFSLEKNLFPQLAEQRRLAIYLKVKHWFTTGTEERLRKAEKFFQKRLTI